MFDQNEPEIAVARFSYPFTRTHAATASPELIKKRMTSDILGGSIDTVSKAHSLGMISQFVPQASQDTTSAGERVKTTVRGRLSLMRG